MRRLAQPSVVKAAALAALVSTVSSLPRMLLWEKRPYLAWYVEAILFCCGFILWAFVFAWHTEYTHRPLFQFRIPPLLVAGATVVGVIASLGHHWLLDPSLRATNPEDYPPDLLHWVAHVLFTLSFNQLFLLFAPFAWAMRLFRSEKIATWVVVALGLLVLILKTNASPLPLSGPLLLMLAALQIGSAFFGVWFYVRGGILLAWWIAFLIDARHLLTFCGL